MTILHLSFSLPNSSLPLYNPTVSPIIAARGNAFSFPPKFSKAPTFSSSVPLVLVRNFPVWGRSHVLFCSRNDVFEEFPSTRLSRKNQDERFREIGELELLDKPSPSASEIDGSGSELGPKKPSEDEALAPFLKFFKSRDPVEEASGGGESEEKGSQAVEGRREDSEKNSDSKKVSVEYYEPKPGDLVVGVVVSGNENKLDVNVGADLLGTMLTKEVLPLYDKEMEYLLCDVEKDAAEFMVRGKMGIVKNGDAASEEDEPFLPSSGRPVVENGTVLFAEVLGRTLSGRPLLSSRRLFRKVAWHRVRQIEQLNEPIEVRITEWNTGGLLTRIEGLRAFLPKTELMGRVNNFTQLKENVGRRMHVKITRINDANNELILSEREAWESLHLQDGTLLEGTVKKIFPYGAQIRIGETNRSGLLHISKITKGQVTSVDDVLKLDEKVTVLVVKSMFPGKIYLSTADLESEPGNFISNREKVLSEAEEMAKEYRKKLPVLSATRKLQPSSTDALPFDDEAIMYSNWRWFKFERDSGST